MKHSSFEIVLTFMAFLAIGFALAFSALNLVDVITARGGLNAYCATNPFADYVIFTLIIFTIVYLIGLYFTIIIIKDK